MSLIVRRKSLLGANTSGKIWLYRNGVISPLIGDFITDGYQYGPSFSQTKGETDLMIAATSPYNIRGGRTFTGLNPIPAKYIGKTLHCKVTLCNVQRASFARLYLSENVVSVSDVENVNDSGAFINSAFSEVTMNDTVDLSLPVTQAGYLSVMMYKGYPGLVSAEFEEIWIE